MGKRKGQKEGEEEVEGGRMRWRGKEERGG